MQLRNAVIVDDVRTPFGRGGRGKLVATRLDETGARLVTTVAKELRRSNTRYGLATQCIGAGMGISTILERLD